MRTYKLNEANWITACKEHRGITLMSSRGRLSNSGMANLR